MKKQCIFRLDPLDIQALENIRKRFGLTSSVEALRLALRLVEKAEVKIAIKKPIR